MTSDQDYSGAALMTDDLETITLDAIDSVLAAAQSDKVHA